MNTPDSQVHGSVGIPTNPPVPLDMPDLDLQAGSVAPPLGPRVALLRDVRRSAEREAITIALQEYNGNVPAAAKALRISRAQLYRLIARLQMSPRGLSITPPPANEAADLQH